MAVHFTSDTHFGDPRGLRIDRRPFSDLAAHDSALVEAWNAVVAPEDEVWHLSDFALGPPPEKVHALLESLAGRKHLIIGNNDGPATLAAPGWDSVGHYAEIDVEERRLVLCHYAFRTWNGMGRGALNLHGHSHGRLGPMPRLYDVGVDPMGFRPVRLETILASRRVAAARRESRKKLEPNGSLAVHRIGTATIGLTVSGRSRSHRFECTTMRHTILSAGLAATLLTIAALPASASPSCGEGERKVQEASALRYQARQEARLGNHDRVCDTLDEVGDRYRDAQGAFEDCGSDIASIDIRSELRNLRLAKHVNRCD